MMNDEADFKKLEVWQLAHQLTLEVYRATKTFPSEEKFRIVDQLCRATSSIPANIVEGQGRYQLNDQIHFLIMARGSLQETRYFLILAHDLGYLSPADFARTENLASKLFAKLSAFIASKRRFMDQKKTKTSNVERPASGGTPPPSPHPSVERRAACPATAGSSAERSSIKGFTLIELLTVISIIAILAGLTIGVSSYANRNAVESRIKAELKAMETALEAYKADYGGYPPLYPPPDDVNAFTPGNPLPADGRQISTNFVATTGVPKSNGWLNCYFVWRALSGTNTPKTYMTFTPKQLSTQTVSGVTYTLILDPNGNPYGYNPYNPKGNPQTFDLFSAGVDGKCSYPTLTSTNDDLGNWQR